MHRHECHNIARFLAVKVGANPITSYTAGPESVTWWGPVVILDC